MINGNYRITEPSHFGYDVSTLLQRHYYLLISTFNITNISYDDTNIYYVITNVYYILCHLLCHHNIYYSVTNIYYAITYAITNIYYAIITIYYGVTVIFMITKKMVFVIPLSHPEVKISRRSIKYYLFIEL